MRPDALAKKQGRLRVRRFFEVVVEGLYFLVGGVLLALGVRYLLNWNKRKAIRLAEQKRLAKAELKRQKREKKRKPRLR